MDLNTTKLNLLNYKQIVKNFSSRLNVEKYLFDLYMYLATYYSYVHVGTYVLSVN